MKVDAATLAGSGENQDAYTVLDHAVIILDGASSFPPVTGRNGGWHARHLRDALAQQLTDQPHAPLVDVLAAAVTDLRDTQQLEPGGPSSAVAIARNRGGETWDLLVLGDTTIVCDTAAGIEVVHDERLARVATAERAAYRNRLATGAGYDDHHAALVNNLQAVQRAARNTSGGYWIADAEPAAATHAVVRAIPTRDVRRLALVTDGAAAAVTRYGSPADWSEYLDELDRVGAVRTLHATQDVENTDPDGRRWPRSKRHDDKTAVLFRQ